MGKASALLESAQAVNSTPKRSLVEASLIDCTINYIEKNCT